MKKFLSLIFTSVFILSTFAACSNKNESNTEKVYSAEYKNADSFGYIPFVELTISADGKIVDVVFDWKKADDENYRKSTDEEYAETWRGVYPDMDQNVAIDSLVKQLKNTQDIKKVDAVTGATSASDEFIDIVTQLLEERVDKNSTKLLVIEN